LTTAELRENVAELATRPGHDKVRTLVYDLLVHHLGANSRDVSFEAQLKEVRGRTDALLGRTVFEIKANLRREDKDAEEQLLRYLSQREKDTGDHFVGIATDGATFVAYELRHGELRKIKTYATLADQPTELTAWLSAAVAVSDELPPEPETVKRELGRDSLAWHMARELLAELWAGVADHPEVQLKRELWAGLLERVYGSSVDSDQLFFQHTYLTVVSKTMALHILGLEMPEPAALLSGERFAEAGIYGVVESDFFDWLLHSSGGADFVHRVAAQASRFSLRDVEMDVLKGLYESLIDPEQRHDLGEYYTPDWLAARMCERAIETPLTQRVLDPACGSGTFLFHAIRRFIITAEEGGMDAADILTGCTRLVRGIDVHPVAVQIARVTYLLALGKDRLRQRPGELHIPVYIGDSLQWNTTGFLTAREVQIDVPKDKQPLHFPFGVAQDPGLFDAVINRMISLSDQDAEGDALSGWLEGLDVLKGGDVKSLVKTYEHLRKLKKAGRNHIWGFVARNLIRPAWLSRDDEKSDVIIGNPPWLAYRYMSTETKKAFRKACMDRGIWAGGKVATHQDLSAYFFARCVELYFPLTGVIAFVMPYAAMSRRQYEGFRKGVFGQHKLKTKAERIIFMRFTEGWAFSDDVQPLFPVPSCVLFGELRSIGGTGRVLPATVRSASGHLPRRDATAEEAAAALTWTEAPWPAASGEDRESEYRESFRQGATMVPRMLCLVDLVDVALGANPQAPLVQSHRSKQEKSPWKTLPALRGNVEAEFLRPLYLGESIAPFRLLEPITTIIPWRDGLLDSTAAQRVGEARLAGWLAKAERLWKTQGRSSMTLMERWNYNGGLDSQFPIASVRVVYAASGTLPAAATLFDARSTVEHKLYWAAVGGIDEARYLCAVLNSETSRERVAHLQSRGQWGARDFDKVIFELPIPKFDTSQALHARLVNACERAEQVAAATQLVPGEYFVRARGRIREALQEDGVAGEIDGLVAELLGPVV
jgi:SAM-dependent methyltransferase